MASDLLGIGTSGLMAFQRSLNTISHNIANANTEGYSRQTTDLVTRPPQGTGAGFIGNGVNTSTITRSYDAFVEGNVRSSASSLAEHEAFHSLAVQLDNILANPDTGMSASIQRFFNAVQDVADNPSSSTGRQVMFDTGQELVQQFNEVAEWIDGLRSQVNAELRNGVTDINRLAQSIAEVNEAIVLQQAGANGQPPNDLLDQRDMLIRELSELVSVTTLEQDNGALNVMVGTGQVLVLGNSASELEVFVEAGADPLRLSIGLKGNGGILIPVTDQLTGGTIGGVIGFRERMLDPAANSLGLVAIGLGSFFNEQHTKGVDIDGALGIDFFNVPQPDAITLNGTPDNISVAFDDISQLTNADYELQYNTGAWGLIRTDTGQSVAMTGSGTAIDPFIADGMQIEILAAPPVNGDTYLIRPTRNGALNLEMNLADSRQIATASPVRSETALFNTGSGVISAGVVTDIKNAAFQTVPGSLAPPLLISFTGGASYDIYDNTIPAAPVLLEAGIAYNPATGGDVFPTPGVLDYGYQMTLTGAPVAGDEFTIDFNTGGTGDNRNALLLAGLSTEKLMNGGTDSISQVYSGLVGEVGTGTAQAERNSITQQVLYDQSVATRENMVGVNLDEEAADLIRFQQAYQAAAQVISTAQSLFDTLLNAVR